jgi:hypothetical protein
MQQLAPGSLSEQYFVGLGVMLLAYEMAHWRTGVRSFDAVGQTDFRFIGSYLDARATNSFTFESKSLRMGDWFDFL